MLCYPDQSCCKGLRLSRSGRQPVKSDRQAFGPIPSPGTTLRVQVQPVPIPYCAIDALSGVSTFLWTCLRKRLSPVLAYCSEVSSNHQGLLPVVEINRNAF